MKKIFTNLVKGCLAIVLLGGGVSVYAQTYWDSGCGCSGGTYDVGNTTTTYHNGLNIDGTRYTYWFSYGTPLNNRPTFSFSDVASPSPATGYYLYWDGSNRLVWLHATWIQGSCTHNSGTPSYICDRWNWIFNGSDTDVTYPDNLYPYTAGGVCKTGNVTRGDGHLTSTPSGHNHGPITVNVNSDAGCGATHFKWFHWGNPTWGHYQFTYNVNSNSWSLGSPGADGVNKQSLLTNNTGTFVLKDGVNIRLEDKDQFYAVGTNIATRVVEFKGNYTIRFDSMFSGTTGATSVIGTQAANLGTPVSTNNTIGLWKGTDKAYPLSFVNGGTLLLGPNSVNQEKINLDATGGTINVNNYVCCNGSTLHANDGLWEKHGMYFNVTGTITNSNLSHINIKNECDVNCDQNGFGVLKNESGAADAWLQLGGSKIPDLWKGNVFASASGAVKFPDVVSATAATGTHEVESRHNSLIFAQDYTVTNTDANGWENYHVDGDCCGSYIWAHGNQNYTFSGANGKLDMITAYGGIEMDEEFKFTGTGTDNRLNMLGNARINIKKPVYVETKDNGHARLYSDNGNILLESTLESVQKGAPTGKNGFTLWANGTCVSNTCFSGGYVTVNGSISLTNTGAGLDSIVSSKDTVSLKSGIAYSGVNGKLLIDGFKSVNISGAHNGTTPPLPSGITLGAAHGTNEGVYIFRTGTGSDSIHSIEGHIDITNPFTYLQQTAASSNGLTLLAEGGCNATADCDSKFLGGYVWLQNNIKTTNQSNGYVNIWSNNHYVRIGKESASGTYNGGHLTHSGQSGNLSILAGTNSTCYNACGESDLGSLPDVRLKPDSITEAHPRRGYVWIGDDVNIAFDGSGTSTLSDSNAVIRSYKDIVQMDDTVSFTDTKGANFWIDGLWGVRTLGPSILHNVWHSGTGIGTAPGVQPEYETDGQGYVTYLSKNGYVDFGIAPNIGNDNPAAIGGNTPFLYKAENQANALLIEGKSRVFFGDSVTIAMGTAKSDTSGNAKIYSPAGWIMFADTLGYTGTTGDLIVYANGNGSKQNRSQWNYELTCGTPGGFILFDSITQITYKNAADTGKTWIRSNHDDVVIGDMFTYKSEQPTHAGKNGEFIMQAGQDIYGRNPLYEDTIHFVQQGDSSILLEAKKTIHLQQMLLVDRKNAVKGDITLKAGYNSFAEGTMDSRAASYRDAVPAAKLSGLTWTAGNCLFPNYNDRHPDQSSDGGDIWFESRVKIDLAKTTPTADSIATTLRAFHSIFIDSTFVYDQDTAMTVKHSNDNVLLFAEIGNIEAAVTRQDRTTFPTNGYIADDTVLFMFNQDFKKEFRMQAGNQVWGATHDDNEDAAPTKFNDCWIKDHNPGAEYFGNILFNKPFIMENKGMGKTIISAARDIETQVMAPFTFNYYNQSSDNLYITAGRHIETHAKMLFNYPLNYSSDSANITIKAGRLNELTYTGSDKLCKDVEAGSNLAKDTPTTDPFDPDVETGNNSHKNNEFAKGGSGHGSILLFDSMEFNYKGAGKIWMVAKNGNIESDPYLHRTPNTPANPGLGGLSGNLGYGYLPTIGWGTLQSPPAINTEHQHDAQLTFNHAGTGITELEAINIKLHDRIEYAGTSAPVPLMNGRFNMLAYDSILTRNLKYTNATDTGSVFITTTKYKSTDVECAEDPIFCATTGAIRQGHIVLGYGADYVKGNITDSIIFNYNKDGDNTNTLNGNIHILAGFEGFEKNKINGKPNQTQFDFNPDKNRNKGYGGNITFDYTEFYMPTGNGRTGGFTEIRTPNGNIWGKDSILYRGVNGDLLVDAGLGSMDDKRAILWRSAGDDYVACNRPDILNTRVPFECVPYKLLWRTGNIMMKGAHLNFGMLKTTTPGTGDAIFRTREGYIDMYDAFTVDSMAGNLLVYAGMDNLTEGLGNSFGDVSMRDFAFSPVVNNGSIFFGADDNIMLNYGNSNLSYPTYGGASPADPKKGFPEWYNQTEVNYLTPNPYYSTSYLNYIPDLYTATYNVNKDGYLFYKSGRTYAHNNMHYMFRGTDGNGVSGNCVTKENGARDLDVNFETSTSGGFASVASNFIDLFTKFTYLGGDGTGLGSVPGMSNLHGEDVRGFGLYLKSQFNAGGSNSPEKRRVTCEDCGKSESFSREQKQSTAIPEMTYIGFHDDARIHTQNQKTWIEAPVTEFFGHAELDAYRGNLGKANITVKTDSLIFHDSVIIEGPFVSGVNLIPFTTDETQRFNDMRYGVINDGGDNLKYYENSNRDVLGYEKAGPAISMEDRNLPVLELGYQRCTPPGVAPISAPNRRSIAGRESTPTVGGDLILAFKWDFKLPMFNSVVANNARISFLTDSFDHVLGGEYINAFIRTDLLRIRNKVEFYTDPAQPKYRSGKFVLADHAYMDELMNDAGMYVNHLHTEPGSELSIPGEDSLIIWAKTTVGGYGNIHENIFVKNGGILAPGHASLMEDDCATPPHQGKLTIHDLAMEQHSILRISIGKDNPCIDADGNKSFCTGTDLLSVNDTIYFNGKIPLLVLPEGDNLQPGCYPFMEYGDSLGVSKEYVRNLVLLQQRHLDVYFGLDFSQPGKVLLCVSRLPNPEIQRYVDLPLMEGVSYNYIKVNGEKAIHVVGRNYVKSHQDFEMNLSFTGTPQKVWAQGFYSNTTLDLDATATRDADGSFTYIIRQVVEPWSISFGPQLSTVPTGNGILDAQNVWTYRNTLYINVPVEDVVSIYSITGVLNRKLEVPAGLTKQVLDRGVYIVTLKDGKVYKIIVK